MNFFRLVFSLLATAILTCIAFVVAMGPLIALPAPYIVLDGSIAGILLSALCFFLHGIVKYGQYSNLSFMQSMVNYGALAVLFVVGWVGVGMYLLYVLLPENTLSLFFPTLPIRVVIALLVYMLVVLFYERTYGSVQTSETAANVELENLSTEEAMESTEDGVGSLGQEMLEHIAVKNGQKIDLVFISDVIFIQAEGDYVMLHTLKGKFLKEQTMKYFADHLLKNKFVRVHRSSIVNIDFIQRIELYEKQNQVLKLQNNLQAKMSVAGYKELKKVLNL